MYPQYREENRVGELVVDDDAHAASDDDGRKLEDILVAHVWEGVDVS